MSKQLFKRNQTTSSASTMVAGTGISITGTTVAIDDTIVAKDADLTNVTTAPVWKSLHNFDGSSILESGVAQYLNGFSPAQAMRVKYGTAYLVTLRGMLVKPGGFAVGGTAFTLPAGWRPTAGRVTFAVTGHETTRGRLDVLTNGSVVNVVGGSYLDLGGVSFWTN